MSADLVQAKISIASLRIDDGVQSRVQLDERCVDDYAALMADGVRFPPIVVFREDAASWLADGFHRVAAARKAGIGELDAEIREGTRRDALLHAAGANATHGLRRTNSDKRAAVEVLLFDPEWSKWSNRKIAKHCGVTHPFVAGIRKAGGNYYRLVAGFAAISAETWRIAGEDADIVNIRAEEARCRSHIDRLDNERRPVFERFYEMYDRFDELELDDLLELRKLAIAGQGLATEGVLWIDRALGCIITELERLQKLQADRTAA